MSSFRRSSISCRKVVDSMARAIGPLAAVLVEDEILDLGYQPDGFPKVRLKDLIDRLSSNIRKEDKNRLIKKVREEKGKAFLNKNLPCGFIKL